MAGQCTVQAARLGLAALCVSLTMLVGCDQKLHLPLHVSTKSDLVLPDVVAGYYPNWATAPPRLRDVHPQYNVINIYIGWPDSSPQNPEPPLAVLLPGDGRTAASNFIADVGYVRSVQGRKVIATLAGNERKANFTNHSQSLVFIDGLAALIQKLGGLDGLDWGAVGVVNASDQNEMIWISQELKRRYPGFIITASPLPRNALDKEFCREMIERGVLDYASPQFYDSVTLAEPDSILDGVREWVDLLGAVHVVVGFGINNAANYLDINRAESTWQKIKSAHPRIRGGSDWDVNMDERQGWIFANALGPMINPVTSQ